MSMYGGCLRTVIVGCLGLVTLLLLAGLAIFLFRPSLFNQGLDWVFYKPPPELPAADPGGSGQTEKFFREVAALGAGSNRFVGRAELGERQANAYLQEALKGSKSFRGFDELQVDFLEDRVDIYATVDPAAMRESDEFREFAEAIPAGFRNRRTSLHIELEQPRIENRRFAFRQVSMYVGHLPLPFSTYYLMSLLKLLPGGDLTAQMVANGFPLPPKTKVAILPEKIEITPLP